MPLQNVLLDGATGNPSFNGGEVEVSLDIEMVISMATNLSKVIVYEVPSPQTPSPGPIVDILNRMVTDNLAKQLSCSWYVLNGTNDPAADQAFQEMAAQGQSFFNASGDSDAYTGLISFPGDTPYATQVGGTTLTTSGAGGAWASETVWNWDVEFGSTYDGQGSSGGISTQYPIPSWQTNVNMVASQGSTTERNIPDVAMVADNIYVRADGTDLNNGGTSCAAPLWAAFTALVNQQAAIDGQPAVGFLNPALYTLGNGGSYNSLFHDITTGSNTWSASPTKFRAVTGYDLCTGWGTPAGQRLINALANPEPLNITPLAGFAAIGKAGGPFSVASQNFSLTNIGTSALTWSLSNTSTWLAVSLSSGTLTPGGPASIVSVSFNTAASNLVVGSYSTTIWFTNQADGFVQNRQFTLSILSPPAITVQPSNQAVAQGAKAVFAVQASGGTPLAYQWSFNGTNLTDGGNISGSSTTNLTISNASATNVGTYSVEVTNYAGVAISSNAMLSIVTSPPVIVLQPTNQAVFIGTTVQFVVGVIGSMPFSYQWAFDGTNILNATNAVLTLTDVQTNQTGNYSVAITNLYGLTNSFAANLTVYPALQCDAVPSGAVAWWPGQSNAVDIIGTNNGTLVGNVAFGPGEVGLGFSLDGSTTYVAVPASPSLNVGASPAGFTIESWISPGSVTYQEGAPIIEWDTSDGAIGTHFWAFSYLFANLIDTAGNPHAMQSADNSIAQGVLQHVALTYDPIGGNAILYCNGTNILTQNLGSFVPQTTYPLNIGRRIGGGENFQGIIDEPTIYNRVLSSSEIAAIYLAGTNGKCMAPTPPVITMQPANESVPVGGTAVFTVTATGTPPLAYQWAFDGTNILNATNVVLTLANVQTNQAGNYTVLVASPYGSTNSIVAGLTVTPALQCKALPSGADAWWPGQSNAVDVIGTNNGTLVGNVAFAPGEVGLGFSLDGSTTYVAVPASPSLNVGASPTGFTIESWISPGSLTYQEGAPIIEWDSSGCVVGTHFWAFSYLFANLIDTAGNPHVMQSADNSIVQGVLQHVALTYDPISGNAILYCNGTNILTQNLGSFVPQTTYPLNIGRRIGGGEDFRGDH